MKKLITLLIPVLLFAAGTTYGQVSGYSFVQSTGNTYAPLTSATSIFSGTSQDDNLSGSIPIGFTFNMNGSNFTSVYVNTNGDIYFGGSGYAYDYQPCAASTTATGIIAALAADLNSYDATSVCRYKTEGTSPNRKFTVEWFNWSRYGQSASRFNFQITCEETTNKVYLKYGTFTSVPATTVQVGMRGLSSSDYINRTTTTDWTATTAGGSNSATCTLSSTIFPPSGLMFTYTPGIINPGSFTATPISTSQINLGWTLNPSTNPVMLVYNTTGLFTAPTNGTSYVAGNTIGTGTSSVTVLYVGSLLAFQHLGLTQATTYYYRIYSVATGNVYSIGAVTSATTLCTPGTVTISTPYTEGFEGITGANQLPPCWAATNFGSLTGTDIVPLTYNRGPRTGVGYGWIRWSSNEHFFTKQVHLVAGTLYKASVWYKDDGATGFGPLELKFGTGQTAALQTTLIASVPANITNTTYLELQGNFQVPTTGDYYMSVHCVSTTSTPWYLDIDDYSVSMVAGPPSGLTATSSIYHTIDLNWTPNASNDAVMLVYNTTNTFGTPVNGVQYLPGNSVGGGGTVLYVGTGTTFAHTGRLPNTTYYYRAFSTTGAPTNIFTLPVSASFLTTTATNPPTSFVATAFSSSQINLSWALYSGNPVILVANTANTFGPLETGVSYSVGSSIPGGGTVIYSGTGTSFAHTGLNMGIPYYYQIYSYLPSPLFYYSNPVAANATPPCTGTITLPYSWDFNASITNGCWTTEIVSGDNYDWTSMTSVGVGPPITPHSGSYFAFYDAWNAPTDYSARLKAPPINLSSPSLNHPRFVFWRTVDGNALAGYDWIQPQYSLNNGGTWFDLGPQLPRFDASLPGDIYGDTPASWRETFLDLDALKGNSNVLIGFLAVSQYGGNMGLDLMGLRELAPATCATTPVPATGATGVIRNVGTLSWTAGTGDIVKYIIKLGTSLANMAVVDSVTTTNYTLPFTLAANTTYYWQAIPTNGVALATGCDVWSFTTGANLLYCASGATSTADEDIKQFVFAGINNTSATFCELYTDYTNISGNAIKGFEYPVSITKKDCEGQYFYGWQAAVFIDLNQNGVFDLPSEEMFLGPYTSSGTDEWTVSGTITIPETALNGPTRIRVVMIEGSGPQPCGTYTWGETEDYLLNVIPYDKDLAIINWLTPLDDCSLTATEAVSVTYTNLGNVTQDNYTLSYYNGTTWVNETVTTPIAHGQILTYTFNQLADFSAPGEYNIQTAVYLADDVITSNDSSDAMKLRNYPVIVVTDPEVTLTPGPYVQNFDDGDGFWYPNGSNNCWELGTPVKTFLNAAASAPNAWVTKLSGNYTNDANCWVESPCFDLSALLNPIFQMDIKYKNQAHQDGALLLSNIDGAGWNVVGDLYQLTNWYNDNAWEGSTVWSGTSIGNGYVTVKHQIEGAGGHSNVKLGVLFISDHTVVSEGTAFDNVTVFESPILFASVPDINIEGSNGDTLNLKIKGGVPPYHILWTPAAGLSCNVAFCGSNCVPENCQKPIATPLVTTTYTAKVWDSKVGKAADTIWVSATVHVFPALTVDARWDATVCDTAYTQIYAMVNGGLAPYTYQWDNVATLTNGTIFNPVATPHTTTTYSVTITDALGFQVFDQVTITTVSGYPQVDIHPNGGTICLGDALQLTATGGTGYLWTVYPPSQAGTISATDIANPFVSPTISGVKYSCLITSPCGNASDFVIVNVIPKPIVTWNTFAPNHFCEYENTPILLTGGFPVGGTYSGAGVDGGYFNPSLAGYGTHIITYTYINAAVNNCPGVATYEITVYRAPNVGLSLPVPNHCIGEAPFTVTGGAPSCIGAPIGCIGIYSGPGVSGGMFDPSIGVGAYPIIYSYTSPTTGCSAVSHADTMFVFAKPSVTWNWDTAVCVTSEIFALHGGEPVGGVYSGDGVTTSPNFDPSLVGPGVYTVYYTYADDNECDSTVSSTITVYGLPTVIANISNSTICIGESVDETIELTGTGPWTIEWTMDDVAQTPFVVTTSPFTFPLSPTVTTNYAITAISDAHCSNDITDILLTITVNELPLKYYVVMNDPDGHYCVNTGGIAVGLHNSEVGVTYKLYKDGVFTGNTFIGPGTAFWFYPNITEDGIYTVEAISNVSPTNCGTFMTGSAHIYTDTLHVNIAVEFDSVCLGGTSVLDAYLINPQISENPGTFVFKWTPLADLSPNGFTSVLAHPSTSEYFAVTVFDEGGCMAKDSVFITVNALPNISINESPTSTICDGSGDTLFVNNLSGSTIVNYAWTPTTNLDLTNPAAPIASPHASTAYTVVVTDENGCQGSATHNVLVTPSPNVIFTGPNSAHICPGGSTQILLQTPTVGSGMYTYSWTSVPAGFTSNLQQPTVAPLVNTVYTVVIHDVYSNCNSTGTFTVSVNTAIAVQLGDNFDICLGTAANLFANVTGGFAPLTFAWTSVPSLAIAPVQNPAVIPNVLGTTIVTVVVTDFYGCTATDNVAITAGNVPVAHAGPNDTICQGDCSTLMGSGGTSYQWFTNNLPISQVSPFPYITVCPQVTTTYELRVTSPCGAAISHVTVVVNPATPIVITMPQNLFCQGGPAVTVVGSPTDANGVFGVLSGLTDHHNGTASFAPTLVGTYNITYTYTNQWGCDYSATYPVTVLPIPVVTFTDIADVCVNTPSFTLTTGSPVNGTYSGVGVSGGIFNPAIAGIGEHTITYTVTGANGCTNSASIVINVNSLPAIFDASVSNGGVYCDYPNATGVDITLNGSAPYGSGVVYTLVLNGYTTGISMVGTGYPIVFQNITSTGTYQVLATNTASGCSELMNGIMNVEIAPLPLEYTVTGGGAYCQGGTGVQVGLDNSNYGITYYLYRNGSYTGISHAGVNGAFNFTTLVVPIGTYTVVAINDVTGCEKTMLGSVQVSTYPLPFPYFVYIGNSGQQSITTCAGTSITIRQNANECGVIYELYHNGVPTGETRTCANGASFTWIHNNWAPGVYTVVGTRVSTGCKKQMNGSATINYYTPITIASNPADQYIDDGGNASFTVVANGYNPGYQWEYSQNGVGPWTNVPALDPHYTGVNAATLYVNNAPYDDWTRNKYRVKVTGPCNTVYSGAATLYIDPIVNVILGNVAACAQDTVFVPITFTHADSINAISLTITYDNANFTFINPTGAIYPGYKDLNPILNSSNLSILGIGNTIRISYFDLNSSINNGYVNPFEFLKLGFKAINAGGTIHYLNFVTSIPGACELSKISGEILTANFINGSATVVAMPVIVSAGAVDNDVCQHENIYLHAVATHPNGVTYTWSTPPSYIPVTSASGDLTIYDASPANTGMYYLTVTSNGLQGEPNQPSCPATASFNVTVNPEPVLFNVIKPNGDAACAGSGVEIALSGSETGVTYELYLEPNNITPVEVRAGTGSMISFGPQAVTGDYTVKATSVHGCIRWMVGTAHIQINPLPLWFNVLGGGHYCAGGNGREIRLNGSQLGVQYTLLLNACCCQADSIIQTVTGTGSPITFGYHLTPGFYSVVAVNPNTGCQNNMIGCVPIIVDPLPTAHLVGGSSVCTGTSTTLTLTLTGKAPWTVVLSNGTTNFTVNPHPTSSPWTFTVNPATTTTYTIVSVTDGNNCTNTGTGTATIEVWDLPGVVASSNSAVCIGSMIQLTSTVSGFGPFTFAWTGPNGFVSTDQNPVIPVSAMNNAGVYTVTVTDGHGCVNTSETSVVVNPLPTVILEANSPCIGGTLSIYAIPGGQGNYTYSWIGPNYTGTGSSVVIPNVTAANAGDYTVTITDGNGCVNTATITVVINPLPVVTCGGATVCAGQTINLTASATGNGPFTYYWSGPNGWYSNDQNPAIANATVAMAGTYTVTVYDAHECIGTCTSTVIVNPLPEICQVRITEPNVYCFGCIPPEISLGCSTIGVTYTLYLNGVATTHVLAGTGQAINFGQISIPGFYTVHASSGITGCEAWMYGTVEVIEQAPPTATLTGDVICLGETPEMNLVLTGDSYWHVVIFDGVNKDTIYVASSPYTYIPGTGPHILAPTVTTTYTILLVSDRVCYNVGNSATVVVNPLPNKYNMTGGGYFCNGIGVNVGLNGSQVGINYTLHQNGYTLGTVAGTGLPISFGPQADGVYWAVAVNPITGCSSVMNGQVIVLPNPDLIGYEVSGGGSYCFGGTGVSVYLSGSQLGKEYKLLKDGIYTGISMNGTGYALTFANVMAPGVYTVLLFDPATTCTRTMNGSATVVQRPLPTASISGDATICYGDVAHLHVVLTGTAPWTFVISDGINSVVHHTIASTFDTIVNPTSTRTYVITSVVDMYCQNAGSGSALVTVNSPTPYVVTGGGSFCAGGQGVVVGLSGSQIGVNYTLFVNGVATGIVATGTGSPISFGYQTVAGNYTVIATNTLDGCSRTMNGVAVVTIVQLPTIFNVTGGGACCVGCTHVFVCLDGSQVGIRYELYINGQYTGVYKNGNGADFCYEYATVAGTYTIKAVNIASGCWAWMNGSAIVVLYPTAQANISGGGTICLGQSSTVTVTFTEGTAPFSFGLTVDGTTTAYNNITTNPYTITVTPGTYPSSTHNYTLAWVSDIYGCYNNITTGVATVNVTSLPNVTVQGYFGPYCIDQAPVTLAGGYPLGGVWSGVGVDNGVFSPAVAGVGSHVITYTYTNGLGCQGFATTTIVVNALPVVDITPLGTYCVDAAVVDVYGTPAGGYFIGPIGLVDLGSGHAQFHPATAGIGGPYTITYVYTNPQQCTSSAYTTASVVALPNVEYTGLSTTYCVNDPMVELTGLPVGGSFSGPGIVNGHFFSPAAAGVGGPFAVTYTYSNGGYCSNTVTHYVTVLPLPQVCTFEGGGICCIGCSVNGFLNCSQVGVSYQLVRNGNLSVGAAKAGTGYALSWEIFLGGSYHIRATNTITGCTVDMDGTISVDIIPQPTATISGTTTICTGLCAPLTVTLTGTAPFEIWLSNGVDTTVYHNILTNVWSIDVCPTATTTYSVVSLTDEYCGAFGYGSATITVNPMPAIFTVTGGGTICANDNSGVAVGLSGSEVGVYYELFLDGVTTANVHLGNGSAFNFGTFYNAGTYTVKSTSLSTCVYNMDGSAVISTYPMTDVTIGTFNNVCVGASPFTLSGGLPAGGVYFVDGVQISYFDPQAVGVGQHVVSYQYTDVHGCTFSASTFISVNEAPIVTLAAFAPVCFNAPEFMLTGGSPMGGNYYVNGVAVTMFNPGDYGVGTYTVTYVYTDGNGCTNNATHNITVLPVPNVQLPQYSDVYLNGTPVVLTGGTPAGGVYSGTHVVNGVFNPIELGTFVITYTYTDNCGTYSAMSEITVIENAIYNITGQVTYDNTAATAMNNTTVHLMSGSTVVATTTTDATGHYGFSNIGTGTYTVHASSTKAWGGVNSNDALLIMKHYVGITPLSGLRLAAADVNGVSGVNSVDALLVAKRFVNQITSFPVGDWVFEVKTVVVTGNAVNNFKALCYGDVNGSYLPPYVKTPATVNLNTVGVKEIKSYESFELPISVAGTLRVGAISLVVNYPENLVTVDGVVVNGASTNFLYTAVDGELRISWYNMEEMTLSANDVLLTLKLRSNNISSASANELALTLDGISEIGDMNAVVISDVNLTYPKLVVAVEEYSISNYPNPFKDVTEIVYNLPESGKVTLKVYNLLGDVVAVLANNVEQSANTYRVSFDGTNLVSGIYTYKIEVAGQTKEFVKSGMMILSK